MSKYSMNMSQEEAPLGGLLLNEGWRIFTIIQIAEQTSKQGNEMFVFHVQDNETANIEKIYAISEEGKRWFLKCLLSAVGCEASKDGVYDWDIEDVLHKQFEGLVVHEPNKYVNRDGEEITNVRHRISKVREIESTMIPEEEKAWDS